MGKFKYLPYIVVNVFLTFYFILAILFYYRKKSGSSIKKSVESYQKSTFIGASTSYYSNVLMCFTRFVSFAYMLIYVVLTIFLTGAHSWIFFTNWNVLCIMAYFFVSFLLTLAHEIYDSSYTTESTLLNIMSNVSTTMYMVLTPTAWFISIVNFALLSQDPNYWNFSGHLITSLSLIVELLQNRIHVEWHHNAFSLAWKVIYIVFAWLIIGTGVYGGWPYDFLETSSPICFFWYNFLLFIDILFFAVFIYASQYKYYIVNKQRFTQKMHSDDAEKELNMRKDINLDDCSGPLLVPSAHSMHSVRDSLMSAEA